MTVSRSIHVSTNDPILFLLMAEKIGIDDLIYKAEIETQT